MLKCLTCGSTFLDLLLQHAVGFWIPHILTANWAICLDLAPSRNAITVEGMVAKACYHNVVFLELVDANRAGGISVLVVGPSVRVGFRIVFQVGAVDFLLGKNGTDDLGT